MAGKEPRLLVTKTTHKNVQDITKVVVSCCFQKHPKTSKNNIINHNNTETVQICPNLSESQLFQAAEFPPAVFNG